MMYTEILYLNIHDINNILLTTNRARVYTLK